MSTPERAPLAMGRDDAPMSRHEALVYATTGPLGALCREILAAHPEFLAEDAAAAAPLVVDPDSQPLPTPLATGNPTRKEIA